MKVRKIKGHEYVYDGDKYLGRKDKLFLVAKKGGIEEAHNEKIEDIKDWTSSGEYLEELIIHQFEHYIKEDILPNNKEALESLKSYTKTYGLSPCVIDNFQSLIDYKVSQKSLKTICRK